MIRKKMIIIIIIMGGKRCKLMLVMNVCWVRDGRVRRLNVNVLELICTLRV